MYRAVASEETVTFAFLAKRVTFLEVGYILLEILLLALLSAGRS